MSELIDIDPFVRRFAMFLRDNWQSIKIARGGSFDENWCDWTQANWEILVESAVPWGQRVRLEIYADGGEAHSPSSRITFPADLPTHRILCVPKGGILLNEIRAAPSQSDEGVFLDRFVAMEGRWFREAPPFDKVLAYVDEQPFVVAIDDVKFVLSAVAPPPVARPAYAGGSPTGPNNSGVSSWADGAVDGRRLRHRRSHSVRHRHLNDRR